MKRNVAFGKWLEQKYIDWITEKGKVLPQKDFADYLGIEPVNISNYINARRNMPDIEAIEKIAAKLGPEIYDVLGLARPDKDLKQVTAVWHLLSEDQKARILAIALDRKDSSNESNE